MAAAWRRAWRSRISSTAHGGDVDGSSLQPADIGSIASGTTTTSSTTAGSTAWTTRSGSFLILQPSAAPVVEENADRELSEEEIVKKLKHIEALVVRFRIDKSAPAERWLSQLEVAWVLHLAQASESGRSFISGQLLYLARSWIQALFEITKSMSMYHFGGGCCVISKVDGPHFFSASEFIRFFEATLSKMLPFVDAVVAARTSAGTTNNRWGSAEPADEKLQALILLRDALSTASVRLMSSSCVDEEARDLLPAELLMAKLDKAIWDTMQESKAGFISCSWIIPRSSNIHPITRSLTSYIKVLRANYGSANRVLHDAFLRGEFVPDDENASHLTNLTKEMVHSLEEQLTRRTQSSPWNTNLMLLFLINNLHFIHQEKQLWPPLAFPMPELAGKIDDYINSYIQDSWAPLLKCLHDPAPPRCFRRNSPLSKFESNFQITYTAQKLWKVPDPEMRRRLREAIVEQVIPDFTEFLKDNTLSTPRISPQEMKRMLQELFEG